MKAIELKIRDAGLLISDPGTAQLFEDDRAEALETLRNCLECLPVGPATEVYGTLLGFLDQGKIAYERASVQRNLAMWVFAFRGDRSAGDPLVRIVRDPVGRKILHAFVGRELYLQLTQDQPCPVFLLSERFFASLKTSRRRTNDGDGVADGFNQQLGKAA